MRRDNAPPRIVNCIIILLYLLLCVIARVLSFSELYSVTSYLMPYMVWCDVRLPWSCFTLRCAILSYVMCRGVVMFRLVSCVMWWSCLGSCDAPRCLGLSQCNAPRCRYVVVPACFDAMWCSVVYSLVTICEIRRDNIALHMIRENANTTRIPLRHIRQHHIA